MNVLVSIIVPVYNVENYLKKCVNSLLEQTYSNIEIILVNDGSTDLSGNICDEYKEKDKRITVVHKNNGGQNSARREGIKIANGKYALFLDSDDWLEINAVHDLVLIAEDYDADIVTFGGFRECDSHSFNIYDFALKEGLYYGSEIIDLTKKIMSSDGILRGMPTKMFRKKLVESVLMSINDKIRFSEDVAVYFSCILKAPKIYVSHMLIYHYIMRENSITRSIHDDLLIQINEFYLYMKGYLIKENVYTMLKDCLDVFIYKNTITSLNKGLMGFDEKITMPQFVMNESLLKPDSKVVLYGAGNVGKSIHKQISKNDKYEIVLWVDKYYEKFKSSLISDVADLKSIEFDCIIVCLKDRNLFENVKNELIIYYGIEQSKIIWADPENLVNKYCG